MDPDVQEQWSGKHVDVHEFGHLPATAGNALGIYLGHGAMVDCGLTSVKKKPVTRIIETAVQRGILKPVLPKAQIYDAPFTRTTQQFSRTRVTRSSIISTRYLIFLENARG